MRRLLPPILAAALLGGLALAPIASAPTAVAQVPDARPNIVVLMTDDQTLRSMWAMPRTRALIGEPGATFANAFVTNPRCCPSRATFLTGQYSHNHGVLTNGPPLGGWPRLRGTTNWLPTWLRRSGYRTAHVGKFLNHYGRVAPREVPAGWDEWHATVDPTTYRYYNYTVNENGELRHYGREPRHYATDFTTRRSAEIIERLAPRPEPFFLSTAFLAPHTGGPWEPGDPIDLGTPAVAERHRDAFPFVTLPRSPAFNELDVSDKPRSIRRPFIGAGRMPVLESLHRQRLQSLLAVDEGVERIVETLRATGELERTLLIFVSDNGYLLGEHRLATGKGKVYDAASRVPLLMRGPGVPAGTRPAQLVNNTDLAATIVDAGRARPGRILDGLSLLRLARDPTLATGRPVLLEVAKGPGFKTTAVRTRRWLYAEHRDGSRELYDLAIDPDQLDSHHADPAYAVVRARLARQLRELRHCRGAGCRVPGRATTR